MKIFPILAVCGILTIPGLCNAEERPYATSAVRTAADNISDHIRSEMIQAEKAMIYNRTVLKVRPGTANVSAFADPNFCALADVIVQCRYRSKAKQKATFAPNDYQPYWPDIGIVTNNGGPALHAFYSPFWDYNWIVALIETGPPPLGKEFLRLWELRLNNVVAYHGAPTDGESCRASLPIGDLLGDVYTNGQQVPMYASNINVIQATNSFTQINPGQSATNNQPVGWVYKDQAGHYWIQSNSALQPALSAAVNAQWLSLGLSYNATTNPHYLGTTPPVLPLAESYASCWPDTPNQGKMG